MNHDPDPVVERTLWRRVAAKFARRGPPRTVVRPSAPPLRLGLIGAGNVARWQHLPALRALGGQFILRAVHDLHPGAAARVAHEFGAAVTPNAEELAARSDVDAVLVCTPAHAHADAVLAALHERKHVLCEKPLARDLAEAETLCSAAQRREGCVAMVNFNLRQRPEFRLVRALIQQGVLGEIYHVTGSVSQGRWFTVDGRPANEREDAAGWKYDPPGVLLDLAPHAIDLMRWWCGEIVATQAWTKRLETSHASTIAACSIQLETDSGTLIQLLSSRLVTGAKEQTTFELSGSRGALRSEAGSLRLWTRDVPRWRTLWVEREHPSALGLFAQAIRGEIHDTCDFNEGWRNQAVLEAVALSAESAGRYRLPVARAAEAAHEKARSATALRGDVLRLRAESDISACGA
ncbi:MAG: hypothetical protein C0518_12640 [Opitutus sp.]|nr:hypothetical protein [Opitutus sp.]